MTPETSETADVEARKAGLLQSWSRSGHPSHSRSLTAEELAERAAVMFEPDDAAEVGLILGERHPELAAELLRHHRPDARSEYVDRRRAAIAAGVFAPDPTLERLVDEAVRALGALVEPPTVDDEAHRAGFAAAVTGGSRADEALLFRRWLEDRAASFAYRSRRAALRARLGLTGGNPPGWLSPPKFSVEVDEAWAAFASQARRRATEPSRPPVADTRRVPPVTLDDSPGDPLAAAADDASAGHPVSVAQATLATAPDGVRAGPSAAASARRPRASS